MANNLFSLEGLRDWLDTKDPNQKFNYQDGRGCLLSQYFSERVGSTRPIRVDSEFVYGLGDMKEIPPAMDDIARCGKDRIVTLDDFILNGSNWDSFTFTFAQARGYMLAVYGI